MSSDTDSRQQDGQAVPLSRKRARYLGDSEDEDDYGIKNREVDDLFKGFSDKEDDGRAAGTETDPTLQHNADPTVQETPDEEPKKKKRVIPKIDENRLLGKTGFPQLKADIKRHKFKGKGHEAEDLKSLLNTYKLWAHQMFPKASFRDAVERVEIICHKNAMQSARKEWLRYSSRSTAEDDFTLAEQLFSDEIPPDDDYDDANVGQQLLPEEDISMSKINGNEQLESDNDDNAIFAAIHDDSLLASKEEVPKSAKPLFSEDDEDAEAEAALLDVDDLY